MALFHVHVHVISKGKTKGGSTGFAQYIRREASEKATQHARYLRREGWTKEDLVAKGYASLPLWAKDASQFFLMADKWERKNATVARCFEIALPREISPQARSALAADIRATYFDHFPSAWAIHNPTDREGKEHPHMHVILSERRQTDPYDRSPKQYFARAAASGEDPATHGVKKDRSWQGPARLRELREGVATLTNAALERDGHAVAVSHASLKAREAGREACVYTTTKDKAQVEVQREILHRDYYPWENDLNLAAWHEQKAREGIRDLSRAAIIDHVRDRFWRHDHSPVRELEREQSWLRAIDREYARTGRERAKAPQCAPQEPLRRQRAREPLPLQSWACGIDGDEDASGGLQVRFREQRRGMSR
jgi:hypothetical protein